MTHDVLLRVSEWHPFGQEKRMDCAHGEWWLWCTESVLEYAGLCLYLDKRYCLSAKSTLPINITERCRKLCHREPVTHLAVVKTGAIRLPFNFSVIHFLPKLPKTLKFRRPTLQLWLMIPNKIFMLPKITKQLWTFQRSLQASIFQYWLTASHPQLPLRTIHPLLLAKKIPFTYLKPQVIRLMSQIPQRH